MIDSLSGKTFIKGNHRIPKDSYIVFFSKSLFAVHKSSDIVPIPETNEFKLEGSHIESEVDFDNWTLKIGGNLVNNVRWFSISQEGDKIRIQSEKFVSVARFNQYLTSILTFGILGCIHLKDKHGDLKGIHDTWEQIQKDIPDSSTLERLLGDPEYIKDAQSIREIYGHISPTGTQVSLPPEDTQGLERIKKDFGSWNKLFEELKRYQELESKIKFLGDDFEEAVKLRDKFWSLGRLSKEAEDFQELKIRYGSLESIVNRLKNYIDPSFKQRLEEENKQLKTQLSHANTQLQRIGTEEDIYSILTLRRNFGGNLDDILRSMQDFKYLKDNHGSLELIKQKLNRLEDLIKLEDTVNKQKRDLERWQVLSKGASLDYLESLKEQKEDKVQEGLELERRIEEILLNLSNDRTSDDFEWKSQHEVTSGKADFLIRLKNKHNKQLTIVVECKRHSYTSEAFENITIKEREDESVSRLINMGIAQLCGYYKDANAQFGLLVTNAKIWSLDKKGIQNISWNIPKEYTNHQMNLLLVHESSFESLMTMIKYINNTLDPEVEVVHTYAEKKAFFNDPRVTELATILQKGLAASHEKIKLLRARLLDIQKHSNNALKYQEKYVKLTEELYLDVYKFLNEEEFYTDKKNYLERGSVEILEENFEEEDE